MGLKCFKYIVWDCNDTKSEKVQCNLPKKQNLYILILKSGWNYYPKSQDKIR